MRLGVCYFALQTFQALNKIYRQNNKHQTTVSGWCGKLNENENISKIRSIGK